MKQYLPFLYVMASGVFQSSLRNIHCDPLNFMAYLLIVHDLQFEKRVQCNSLQGEHIIWYFSNLFDCRIISGGESITKNWCSMDHAFGNAELVQYLLFNVQGMRNQKQDMICPPKLDSQKISGRDRPPQIQEI